MGSHRSSDCLNKFSTVSKVIIFIFKGYDFIFNVKFLRSESDVHGFRILTSKVGPRTERIKKLYRL